MRSCDNTDVRCLAPHALILTMSVACGSGPSGPKNAPAEPPPAVVAQVVADAMVPDAPAPPKLACDAGTSVVAAPAPEPTWRCARADGTLHGPFITLFPDASIEIAGSYVNGALHGAWTRRRPDGSIAEERTYKAGLEDGIRRQRAASGAVLGESTFAGGSGVERVWDESGALYSERTLERGVPHGPSKVFAPDGTIVISARYAEGLLDGPHAFGSRGTLRFEESFSAGVRRGPRKIWGLGVLLAEETYDRRGNLDGEYTLWRRARVMKAKGRFTAGKRTGAWTWWDRANHKEREGRYVAGKRDGTWSEWWEGTLTFTGTYQAGKPNGEFVYFDRAGRELGRFTVVGGTGTMQTFHTNKKPSSKQAIHGGVASGLYQELTPLGKLVVEGRYKNGAKHGVWKKWTSDGALVHEQSWKAGVLDGSMKKYVAGVLATETTYADGKVDGPYAEHRDGKPWITGAFVRDRKHGTWTTYDRDGRVIVTATYKDGVLDGPWRQLDGDAVVEGVMVAGRRSGTWTRTERSGAVSQQTYATP